MTLKTTKERIEQLLVAAANTRFDDCLLTLSREEVTNLCHDADMAGELEKELETGRKAWKVLQQKNADLRAKLDEAYEKAAQVCENGILTADEVLSYLGSGNSGDVGAAYAAMESRSNAAAIRALKEQENKG